MKLLNLFLFLLINSVCFGNDIDALQTCHDVNQFLAKKVDKFFKQYPPLYDSPSVALVKSGRNKFFKVDMDNNGLTDLIVYADEHLLAVLDDGKGKYWLNYLDNGTFSSNKVTLISIDSASLPRKIIIQQWKKSGKTPDTLISMFHGFIEYNTHPARDLSFEKITFKTSQCYGHCPVFELSINKDRTAAYHAIMYNDKGGEFKGVIPAQEFDELMELLRYIGPDKLDNRYDVGWTDDQTATTEIKYNGLSKIISDYGKIGTYGLAILYNKFFSLRTSVDWTK